MILIYTGYLVLSGAVVFLVFYSSLGWSIKAGALTTLVLLGLFTQDHYTSQLGKPIGGFPPSEFVYVHHVAEGDDITLWVWTEEDAHRLYTFPYTQEVAEELEEAKQKTEGGQPQEGQFIPQEDGEGEPGLVVDDWIGPNSERIK